MLTVPRYVSKCTSLFFAESAMLNRILLQVRFRTSY